MPRIGLGLGLGLRQAVAAAGGYDADAQAFFDRVTTAGGTLTTTEKNATNQLVLDMKSAGIWTAMKAVYPMVGASAAACAQNLKSSSFTGTFTSGWTFASTGVTPNGTSAYMDTTFNPFTQLSATSAHASFYLRSGLNANATGYGVIKTDYSERMDIILFNGTLFSAIGSGGSAQCSTTTTPYQSLILGSRTSSTSNKLYTIGVLRDTKTTLNTANLPNNNYYLGSVNQSGGFFTSEQCAFASLGDGLTDTQASNFYTAVQTFNQTLNRQVGAQIVSDADAQAYIDRVYTAGGTLTNTEANAVNQLVIDMKAAGIWTAMKAVYPMVGASAAACAQNLVSSSFTGTFSSGWTFASTGVTPNGTSAYMDTGFVPSTNQTINNCSASVYVRTSVISSGTRTDFGSSDTPNALPLINTETYAPNTRAIYCWDYQTGYTNNTTTDASGMWGMSRLSSANWVSFQRNLSVNQTSTTGYATLPIKSIYLGANNFTGAVGFSDREIAFFHAGNSLTNTQFNNFYTAVQAFQTTLSRQV